MASPVFVVFLFLLSWRGCAVASRCSTKVEDVCSSLAETHGFYDLYLSSQEYSTTELGKTQISVQVKMASTQPCPSLQTPGPKYYKLEAYSNDTSAPAGTFNDPPESSEAELCTDKAIVFSSCIPHVTDLPRTYGWNAPRTYVGNICFRLTILKNGEETCEEIVRCITQDQSAQSENKVQEAVASSDGEHNNTTVELEAVYVTDSYNSEHAAGCYKRRNCTNAKLKTMCATDNKEYPSRCHVKLEGCLTGKNLEVRHAGNCLPITTAPPPPPSQVSDCLEEREDILNSTLDTSQMWVPTCDCHGYYKPVQCDGSKCWCSTRKEGFLRGPRTYFDCGRSDFSGCLL